MISLALISIDNEGTLEIRQASFFTTLVSGG